MKFKLSNHALAEMERRGIPREMLERVLDNPQQVVDERGGKKAYQSQIDFRPSCHAAPAVAYLRLYPSSPEALEKILSRLLELDDSVLNGQFTVVTLDGIRQRALPAPK